MSMKQKIIRDGSGYMSGSSGSYVEFTLPVMTSNIERQEYDIDIVKYSKIDEGDSFSISMFASWDYWNGSQWISLFDDKKLFITGTAEDDTLKVDCFSGYTNFTTDTFRAKMQELSGKRVRWRSSYDTWYNDTNNSMWYLELWNYYKQPTVGDPTFSRDYTNSAVNINVTLLDITAYTISLNGKQYTNTKSIPESAFVIGSNTITINAINGDLNTTKTVSYNFIDYNPVAKTISFTNSTLDYDTTIEVTATNAQRYDLYVNGVFKYTSNTQVFIPPKSSFIIGENACFVRCYNTTSMRYFDTSVLKKTMSVLKPTVSNVNIISDNNLIDEITTLTWQSTYQDAFNVYINDIKVKSSISSNITTDLQAGTFKVGSNKIRVEIVKNPISGIANSGLTVYHEVTKNFSRIMPTISNTVLNGNNRDNVNRVTWNSTNATKYNVFINDSLKTTYNSYYDILQGVLGVGNNKIAVEAVRVTSFDTISVKQEIQVDIVQNTPEVYSLEPHNLNINIENQSNVSFSTSEFCDRWEYFINNKPYSQGTSDKVIPVPKNIFNKGNNTHKVKIYYAPPYNSGDIRVAERISTFTGYGKPQPVELDSTTVYNNATPTITWKNGTSESDSQTAFEIEIMDGETNYIIEEKTIVGDSKSYTIATSLENNKEYIIRISIKNKYDIWSDWSAKVIQTNFNNLLSPNLIISSNVNGITFKVDVIQPENFKEIKIYRKDDIHEDWVCIASNLNSDETMTDYVPQPSIDNYYKARMYDLDGGYSESKTYKINYKLNHYVLTDVQDIQNSITLIGAISTLQPTQKIVDKVFSGNRAPKIYLDDTYYTSGTVKYTCNNSTLHQLEKTINKGKIYCYRDWRGKKLYCFITLGGTTYEDAGLNTVILNLTEINFNEENMYTGNGYRKIIYLDGTYFLDGAVDLSGYDLKTQREVMYNVVY